MILQIQIFRTIINEKYLIFINLTLFNINIKPNNHNEVSRKYLLKFRYVVLFTCLGL